MPLRTIPSNSESKSFGLRRIRNSQYVQNKRLFKRKIQRAFFHLDQDGTNGVINLESFAKVLSVIKVKLKDDEVLNIFQYIDSAKKGSINFVKFMRFIQTPFNPADQIRMDMSLHMHRPAYFQKYHTWHVYFRPPEGLGFHLVPGPNCIAAYFHESKNPKMHEILERGSRLCYINNIRVDRTNFWDIQQTLEKIPCPFNITFRNLCLPDVIEERDTIGSFKLIRRDLTKEQQHLLQRSGTSINLSGERINEKDLVCVYFDHCIHCPLEKAWYLNIHLFMEDGTFSLPSAIIMYLIFFLIFVSTSVYVLETIPGWEWTGWEALEAVVSILFTIEFTIRILCCRNASRYMGDPMNIIDFGSVFPFWIELMSNGSLKPELLRVIRIVRLLRLVRLARSRNLALTITVFTRTFKSVLQWLLMFVIFIILNITIFAAFQYFDESGTLTLIGDCDILSNQTSCFETGFLESYTSNQTSSASCKSSCEEFLTGGCCMFDQITGRCEFRNSTSVTQFPSPGNSFLFSGSCRIKEYRIRQGESDPTPFGDIPSSMWWAAATANMVGYGEIYPIGIGGRILGAISCLLGLLCMAFPLIVVGSSFRASIVRVMYRQNLDLKPEAGIGSVMDLLEDMNAIVGEKMYDSDDELVFLSNQLNSDKKIRQVLKLNSGWSGLPFPVDNNVDRPRMSLFKLYALYEIYGRRFRSVTKGRKKYRRAFKSKLRSAIIRRSKIRKKQNIQQFKIKFGEDIPLTVQYEPWRSSHKESLKETSENEVFVFSDTQLKSSKTDMKSEAKDISKIEGDKVATPTILHENLKYSMMTTGEDNISREESPSLVIQNRSSQSLEEDGYAL